MTYHEFLAYLFDRPTTRWLALELAIAFDEHRHDVPAEHATAC